MSRLKLSGLAGAFSAAGANLEPRARASIRERVRRMRWDPLISDVASGQFLS